eukprot:UN07846
MDSPCRPGNYSSGAVCEPALWIANNNEGHNQNAMFGGCTFDTVGSVNHILSPRFKLRWLGKTCFNQLT